ncbi:MAG TPA: hypothetical protein VKU02_12500 [Gemmataceae bacterium]|nr:hypothetical protein [Gemmataceae bacterium]
MPLESQQLLAREGVPQEDGSGSLGRRPDHGTGKLNEGLIGGGGGKGIRGAEKAIGLLMRAQ